MTDTLILDWMEPLETDALLLEFMEPLTPTYRTVHFGGDRVRLDNNGRVEGRQHPHQGSTDDDELLDIITDGRDAQGIVDLPDKSHGKLFPFMRLLIFIYNL